MKRRLSFLLVLVLLLSMGLTACGGDGPEKTAKEFVSLVQSGEGDKLTEICTESFATEAGMMVAGFKMIKGMDDTFKFDASGYKLEDKDGDTATVSFDIKLTSEGKTEENNSKMTLIKKDGKWLVDSID